MSISRNESKTNSYSSGKRKPYSYETDSEIEQE